MTESILNSVKKVLGIDAEYDAFDQDVILHINSALATLNQLGVGPEEGFMIEDDEAEWGDFIGDDPRLNPVKSYLYLRVRIVFDPPATSFVLASLQEQVKEHEWRLNVEAEGRDRV